MATIGTVCTMCRKVPEKVAIIEAVKVPHISTRAAPESGFTFILRMLFPTTLIIMDRFLGIDTQDSSGDKQRSRPQEYHGAEKSFRRCGGLARGRVGISN